ncbi:MAG: hypothetical protein HOP08_07940 [Cyclobacteriaceae bacterium]|nr:hypothetical protein [Cyclobacteriaceae bacterium]
MKSEEEKLEQLVQQKEFDQLTITEKEFVIRMLGSEEEFAAMKSVESKLATGVAKSVIDPDPAVLLSLKSILKEKRQENSIWAKVFSTKVPAYVSALLVIFSLGIGFMIGLPSGNKIPATSVSAQIKIDTVFITRVDTVIKNQVIYQQVRSSRPSQAKTNVVIPDRVTALPVGVSMKDKEELNKLLVSGSD